MDKFEVPAPIKLEVPAPIKWSKLKAGIATIAKTAFFQENNEKYKSLVQAMEAAKAEILHGIHMHRQRNCCDLLRMLTPVIGNAEKTEKCARWKYCLDACFAFEDGVEGATEELCKELGKKDFKAGIVDHFKMIESSVEEKSFDAIGPAFNAFASRVCSHMHSRIENEMKSGLSCSSFALHWKYFWKGELPKKILVAHEKVGSHTLVSDPQVDMVEWWIRLQPMLPQAVQEFTVETGAGTNIKVDGRAVCVASQVHTILVNLKAFGSFGGDEQIDRIIDLKAKLAEVKELGAGWERDKLLKESVSTRLRLIVEKLGEEVGSLLNQLVKTMHDNLGTLSPAHNELLGDEKLNAFLNVCADPSVSISTLMDSQGDIHDKESGIAAKFARSHLTIGGMKDYKAACSKLGVECDSPASLQVEKTIAIMATLVATQVLTMAVDGGVTKWMVV